MPFDLLNPTTEVRIIRSALVMEIFTLPQLARFAGIKIRTLRSMFSRHLDHFEMHPAQLGNRRGRQSKVYRLTSAARHAYEEPPRPLQPPLRMPLQMPPEATFAGMLEAAAIAFTSAEHALKRSADRSAPFKEREAQTQAAAAHCYAGDQSLQLAARRATTERERRLVAEQRRLALQILRKLMRTQLPR